MNKKPFIIGAYALSIILVVAIILLAVVPVSTYPQIKNPTDDITVSYDSSTSITYSTENQNYEKLLKEIKKGFKVNILTGLFNGYLSSSDKNQVANSLKPSTIYVTFNYLEPQVLKINGKEQTKNSTSLEKIKYKSLSFQVSESNVGSKITVYFTTIDESPAKYTVSYYGNMSGAYNLIKELKP